MEGKAAGTDEDLLGILGSYKGRPVTYAGGIGSFSDLDQVRRLGRGRVDFTVGSALDLFGGPIGYRKLLEYIKN